MKNFRVFLLFSLCTVGAWGQTTVSRATRAEEATLDQRRAELRAALKAMYEQEAQSRDQLFENVSAERHLSQQERADLREQLRAQRREVILDRTQSEP
jgi:hypothetical protein